MISLPSHGRPNEYLPQASGDIPPQLLEAIIKANLATKIKTTLRRQQYQMRRGGTEKSKITDQRGNARRRALVIGSSTGGPDALERYFSAVRGPTNYPTFVVQHMPADFTARLAKRLSTVSSLPTEEAKQDAEALPGHIYVAPGGVHLGLERRDNKVMLRLSEDPPENECKPAVDYLLRDAAEVYGNKLAVAIFTGMGKDGASGALYAKEKGALVVAQDEASSVVWGMPGAAVRAGAVDEILTIEENQRTPQQCTVVTRGER